MSVQELSTTESTAKEHGVQKTKVKWKNKQSVLIFSSRGITLRDRLLIEDLRNLLPHSKRENKTNEKSLENVNEIAALRNCRKCIYFVSKKKNLYMWLSNVSTGPSVEFLVQNYHSTGELKLTGDTVIGARPLLCFDSNFDTPHWSLLKELISQTFNVPHGHPKSHAFVDHVLVFSLVDNKIWFRNYQITDDGGKLEEIGPRFVLNPIRIFEGSYGGVALWSNPVYIPPSENRIILKKQLNAIRDIDSPPPENPKIKRPRLSPSKLVGINAANETKDSKEAKVKTKPFVEKNKKLKKRKKKLKT